MRRLVFGLILITLLGGVLAAPAWAQMATAKGTITGADGKPLAGGKIEMVNHDNGQKYTLKTDKKGQYFSIGISAGTYDITIYDAAGKSITQGPIAKGVRISLGGNSQSGENVFDFNVQQMVNEQQAGITPAQQPGAQQQKLTPEQQKQLEAAAKARAEAEKETKSVTNLNQMLATSKTAADAGNLDLAISTMQDAVKQDATRDVLWAVLGDYELRAARKPGTDAATKTKYSTDAMDAYQKAIAACKVEKPAPSCKDIASYYNNLGQALSNTGKTQDAIAAYDEAVKANPTGAAQYYFNEGAVLTNTGKVDEANAAFDKAIAADPNKAEAHYQKGVNMMAKATLDSKTGAMNAPPGTKEEFEKYLQLSPDGPNAQSAKDILTAMGATVQTSFGSKAPAKKKP